MATSKASPFFPSDHLYLPADINLGIFASIMQCKGKKALARCSIKFWGGDQLPWRDGNDKPVTDTEIIAREQALKDYAQAEDKAVGEDAQSLRGRGVTVGFLLCLTFALDLWDWPTWQVLLLYRYITWCLFAAHHA